MPVYFVWAKSIRESARCPNCQAVNTIVQNAHPNTHATPVPPTKIPIEPAAAVENPFAADANPFASPASQPSANYYSNSYGAPVAAHRGGLILGLGIAAIVCNMFFVPGILAWILGRADLKEIRAGRMDRMGESTTQAGMIMGIVMTCIPILVIGAYIAFVIFLLIVGLLAAAAGA